jgi:hypothetical protein
MKLVRFICTVSRVTGPKLLKARGEMMVSENLASWNQIWRMVETA